MKKLIGLLICFTLILGVFSISAFAETPTTPEETPTETPTAPEIPPVESETPKEDIITPPTEEQPIEEETGHWYDWINNMFDIDYWKTIIATISGFIVMIIPIVSVRKLVLVAFKRISEYLVGKATKEDVDKSNENVTNAIGTTREELKKDIETKTAETNVGVQQLLAIFSVAFMYLDIPDSAKAKINELITAGGNLTAKGEEFIKRAGEIFTDAKAQIDKDIESMPKVETPALDALKEEETATVKE